MPDPPKIELDDSLLNTLGVRAEDILADDIVNDKDTEQKTIAQIKGKYNFDEKKDAFDKKLFLIS